MKRSLTKLGNKSYSVTLPKAWVEKNHLKPRTDIEITESGNRLVISPELLPCEAEPNVILCDLENEEMLISKMISIYREGHNEARLVHINNNQQLLEKLVKFGEKMHGVTVIKEGNAIIMRSAEGIQKRSEIINKCHQNLLWMSEMLTQDPHSAGWQKLVFDIYERVYFLSEYVFRTISLEESSDYRLAITQHCIASTFQSLAEALKRIAEIEYKSPIIVCFGSVSTDLHRLVKAMYDVCMLNKDAKQFYEIRAVIIAKNTENKYKASCNGYVHMAEYFCTKIVRQEAESDEKQGSN